VCSSSLPQMATLNGGGNDTEEGSSGAWAVTSRDEWVGLEEAEFTRRPYFRRLSLISPYLRRQPLARSPCENLKGGIGRWVGGETEGDLEWPCSETTTPHPSETDSEKLKLKPARHVDQFHGTTRSQERKSKRNYGQGFNSRELGAP
jgi:hypothetical protein